MEVANTLAYFDMATITAVKSFIVQAPGHWSSLAKNKILTTFIPGKSRPPASEVVAPPGPNVQNFFVRNLQIFVIS
jgi:hypothetical protein